METVFDIWFTTNDGKEILTMAYGESIEEIEKACKAKIKKSERFVSFEIKEQ